MTTVPNVRCAHAKARLVTLTATYVNAYCAACERGWSGPRYVYVTQHVSHNRRQPPKWVQRLIEAHNCGDNGACSACVRSAA